MKIMDETAVDLPLWVRLVFVAFAAAFGALTIWMAGLAGAGWLAVAGAVLSAGLGLLLLGAADQGQDGAMDVALSLRPGWVGNLVVTGEVYGIIGKRGVADVLGLMQQLGALG